MGKIRLRVRVEPTKVYSRKSHEDEFEIALKRFAELRKHATKKQKIQAAEALKDVSCNYSSFFRASKIKIFKDFEDLEN